MTPRRRQEQSETTPMSRAIETATSLASLEERVRLGFDHVDDALTALALNLTKLTETTNEQSRTLASLTESRQSSRHAVKWFAGVLAGVVVAVIVQFVTRR